MATLMRENDYVMTAHKDGSMVGGYLLKDLEVTVLAKNPTQTGGNPSALLEGLHNLAVPLGLMYIQQSTTKPVSDGLQILKNVSNSVIDESLYDRLLDLVSPKERKNLNSKTRKNKKSRKNKTRKN